MAHLSLEKERETLVTEIGHKHEKSDIFEYLLFISFLFVGEILILFLFLFCFCVFLFFCCF